MKYIDKFRQFESLDNSDVSEIKEFCEEHLVDLYEKGYRVRIKTVQSREGESGDFNRIFLIIESRINQIPKYKENWRKEYVFPWFRVRDYIIPFIDILNDNYKLGNFRMHYDRKDITDDLPIRLNWATKHQHFSVREILEIGNNLKFSELKSITIMIMSKSNS